MAEMSLAALKRYFQPVIDAASTPPQSTGADYPERALAALGRGLAHTASVPGRLAAPNPWPEGSEQWQWYEDSKRQTATNWAPEMALNMIGSPAMGGVSAGGREAVLGSGAVLRKPRGGNKAGTEAAPVNETGTIDVPVLGDTSPINAP